MPSRPEWDETPMPMPSDPEEVLAFVVALGVAALVWLAMSLLRKRAR